MLLLTARARGHLIFYFDCNTEDVQVYLRYCARCLHQKLCVAKTTLAVQHRFNTDAHTFTSILHLSRNIAAGNRQLTRQNEHGICFCVALLLHPGVGRASELVCPVGRPPRGGVEVHVVGVGFESERLAGVAVGRGRGQVDRLVLVVLVSVALWGRQVHSVAVVVLPVGFIVKWLCVLGAKRAGVKSNQSQQKVSVRKILQKSHRRQFP